MALCTLWERKTTRTCNIFVSSFAKRVLRTYGYAKTKAECEKKLAKMIAEKKAEIAKAKKAKKKG